MLLISISTLAKVVFKSELSGGSLTPDDLQSINTSYVTLKSNWANSWLKAQRTGPSGCLRTQATGAALTNYVFLSQTLSVHTHLSRIYEVSRHSTMSFDRMGFKIEIG